MTITNIDEKSTDTQCKVEVHVTHAKISFPGSNSWKDIKTAAGGKGMIESIGKIKRSLTIQEAISSIYEQVINCLIGSHFIMPIEISGHSLGGGLAQELAFWLIKSGLGKINIILDGSIRIGNKAYARYLEEHCDSITWNENGNDPIPLIWPWLSRVGKVVILKPRVFPWLDFDLENGAHSGYWPVEYKR